MKIIKTANYIKIAVTIDQKTKNAVAADFAKVGLDGNKRDFPESDSGISLIAGILQRYAITITDVLNKDLFRGEKGQRNFNIEKKSLAQAKDAFMPGDEITNSMVVYSWYELAPANLGISPAKFEILAYLS